MSAVVERGGAEVLRKRSSLRQRFGSVDTDAICSPKKPLQRHEHFTDRPVHKNKASLLSSDSGYTNYRGFFNLCVLLLVLSNSRVAIENILKYGILVDPLQWVSVFLNEPYHWPIAYLMMLTSIFVGCALRVERRLASAAIGDSTGVFLHTVNLGVMLVLPAVVILVARPNPVASGICLCIYTCYFMKLVSYAQVNAWCRSALRQEQAAALIANGTGSRGRKSRSSESSPRQNRRRSSLRSDAIDHAQDLAGNHVHVSPKHRDRSLDVLAPTVVYPNNLTVSDIVYFMLTPTLCYELNFPRTRRIHKWFLTKRILEVVFLFQVILALCQQWILPILRNSVAPFVQTDRVQLLERLLKLAVPNHVIWLISFYGLFHALLNCLAELLRFADREFYQDWWNSETVSEFWKKWNVPVHRWCVRHCYKPMVKTGFRRWQAALFVFFVSAFFHEYLVSVPLHMFRWWAFMGMLSQMPLNTITTYLLKGKYGNTAVWLSLILGQPLSILMYLHDYYFLNFGPFPAAPEGGGGSISSSVPPSPF